MRQRRGGAWDMTTALVVALHSGDPMVEDFGVSLWNSKVVWCRCRRLVIHKRGKVRLLEALLADVRHGDEGLGIEFGQDL